MVAAWMRAETGVGPSMASGSHTCSGNWADLPMAPMNSSRAMAISVPWPRHARAHLLEHPDVVQGAEGDEDEHHAQAEAEVAHPVDDEGLLAGRGRLGLVIVEADQVVGAEPHRLPAEVEQQVVVGQHQHEHAEGEQAQVGEEAVVAGVAVHVALGVDEDQQAHAGDHQQHDRRQLVHLEADGHLEAPHREPRHSSTTTGSSAPRICDEGRDGQPERAGHGQDGQPVRRSLIHHLPKSRVMRKAASGSTGMSQM